MKSHPHRSPLTGWRSQAWALVLFVALLRGLLPHAALAAVLDQGNPQLAWCAPGKAPVTEVSALAGHGQCLCAPAGEALLAPGWAPSPVVARVAADREIVRPASAGALSPPVQRARGPPLTLG